jgi:hypothetical protein
VRTHSSPTVPQTTPAPPIAPLTHDPQSRLQDLLKAAVARGEVESVGTLLSVFGKAPPPGEALERGEDAIQEELMCPIRHEIFAVPVTLVRGGSKVDVRVIGQSATRQSAL